MLKNKLQKLARLAVVSGVNVQKGQLLIINAPVSEYEFVRMCVEEAYKAGAGAVEVKWNDIHVSKMAYIYQDEETLTDVPDWVEERTKREHDKKACYLSISSSHPGFMKDVDPQKMQKADIAYMQRMKKYMAYTMNNYGQWSIVALPNQDWANKVFPGDPDGLEKLGEAIMATSRVTDDNDPVADWKQHDEDMLKHCEVLNGHNFKTLHFVSELGTDLYVDLVKDHIWVGGGSETPEGVFFNPNIPTEECFCMPHRLGVNGKVHASKPLSYQGKVIENFWFEFKDGKVVDYGAEKEQDVLKNLLDTDEGSRHLGEVALVPYDSPVSRSNILFYNTLFDENASCHLALGNCYPENVRGGTEMSEEEVMALGGNISMNHSDFMFGTKEMSVDGIKENGEVVPVFRHGNFVI